VSGSGLTGKALWCEALGFDGEAARFRWRGSQPASEPRKLTIAEAKEGLAAMFGVSADAIEITIRGSGGCDNVTSVLSHRR
jgi:hypothetical protein